jgi:hypothetical protein
MGPIPPPESFAAAGQAPSKGVDYVVEDCPLKAKWAIEAKVVGADSKPVSGIAVALNRNPQDEIRLATDSDGCVRFTGLESGDYSLSLPTLDGDTWEQIAASRLAPDLARGQGEASWGAAPETGDSPETGAEAGIEHPVVEGDCFSSVAFRHGFLPETLARLKQNDWISRPGRDLHVLFPGNPKSETEGPAEVVTVPPKKRKSVPASTGMRYTLRHKGAPEYLRVHFIDPDGEPRAGVPYLLEIEDPEGGPPLTLDGETDGAGLLEKPIPPTATHAVVTLGRGKAATTIELDIGYLDPIDGIAGVQERLENLGYTCGEDDGEIGLATNWALRRFQAANDLPVTGKIDSATKDTLLKQHHA